MSYSGIGAYDPSARVRRGHLPHLNEEEVYRCFPSR
jgi:hypothetical protein